MLVELTPIPKPLIYDNKVFCWEMSWFCFWGGLYWTIGDCNNRLFLPTLPSATVLVGLLKSWFNPDQTFSAQKHPILQIVVSTPIQNLLCVITDITVLGSNSHRTIVWLQLCSQRSILKLHWYQMTTEWMCLVPYREGSWKRTSTIVSSSFCFQLGQWDFGQWQSPHEWWSCCRQQWPEKHRLLVFWLIYSFNKSRQRNLEFIKKILPWNSLNCNILYRRGFAWKANVTKSLFNS